LLITLPLLSKNALERDTTGETAVERFREEKFGLARGAASGNVSGLDMSHNLRVSRGRRDSVYSLRKHANSAGGMFSRESPNSVMILLAKCACDFNMYTIYAIPFESMEEEEDEDVMVDE
jgi:hypothetical protein